MRLLADTHIIIWALIEPDRLPREARVAFTSPDNEIFASAASFWEIAIKQAIGRLHLPLERLEALVDRLGLRGLPITPAHALAAGRLPRHHADPFDRMLIGQALVEGLTLVTVDPAFAPYGVALLEPAP